MGKLKEKDNEKILSENDERHYLLRISQCYEVFFLLPLPGKYPLK